MTGVSNSWWGRQTHRHSEEAKAEHLVKGPAAGVLVWQSQGDRRAEDGDPGREEAVGLDWQEASWWMKAGEGHLGRETRQALARCGPADGLSRR